MHNRVLTVASATKPAPGVYALAGWGIAISYAIDAPGGWIIIDTGDNTKAAAEMHCVVFLLFFVAGPGPWSIDKLPSRRATK